MRYDNTPIYKYNDQLYFGITQNIDYSEYILYTTKYGDRLDNLAYDFYEDCSKWYIIAAANPDLIWDPFILNIGIEIKIPVIEGIIE